MGNNDTTAPAPPEGVVVSEQLPRYYKRNLCSIGLLGVLFSGWLLRYTELFEIFGGLIALGGIFSWLAFVSKVLPEDRLKSLQNWVDQEIIANAKTWKYVSAVALFLALFGCFWGTVQVEALSSGGAVLIQSAQPPEQSEPAWGLLSAGGMIRSLVWTTFWSPAQVRVKVSGLPDRVVTVLPWTKQEFQVPHSFRRPVVLLRPSVELTQVLANQPRVLIVEYRGEKRENEFKGQALWINCDDDVEVPPDILSRWRDELSHRGLSQLLDFWSPPRALSSAGWQFNPGEKVRFTLVSKDDHNTIVACPTEYTVRSTPERGDACQQGVLNVKETDDVKCGANPKWVLEVALQ